MGAKKKSIPDKVEASVAKKLHLVRTRGSGSVRGDGDCITSYKNRKEHITPIMIDTKHTSKNSESISIKKEELNKVVKQASYRGYIGIIIRHYTDEEQYAIMRLDDLQRILEERGI